MSKPKDFKSSWEYINFYDSDETLNASYYAECVDHLVETMKENEKPNYQGVPSDNERYGDTFPDGAFGIGSKSTDDFSKNPEYQSTAGKSISPIELGEQREINPLDFDTYNTDGTLWEPGEYPDDKPKFTFTYEDHTAREKPPYPSHTIICYGKETMLNVMEHFEGYSYTIQ